MSFFKGHLEIVKQTFSNEEGIDRNLFYKNISLIFLLLDLTSMSFWT